MSEWYTAGTADRDFYTFACPHCGGHVIVHKREVNCQIFRHGVLNTPPFSQIPPHMSETECDDLLSRGAIYGCGKPFRFDGRTASACGYV